MWAFCATCVSWVRRVAVRMLRFQPFSASGILALILALWVLTAVALPRHDLVLTTVCVAILSLLGVFALLVMLGAWGLRRRAQLELTTGSHTFETGARYRLPSRLALARLLPLLHVDVRWRHPRSAWVGLERVTNHRLGAVEAVIPARRAHASEIRRRVRVSDVLGLCRAAITVSQAADLTVLPSRGRLAEQWHLRSLVSGDAIADPRGEAIGDRAELRRYVPGDPARFIHWKLYGRTGVAMVRQPEAAVAQSSRIALFFVAGALDEASAGAARVLLERLPAEHASSQLSWHFSASGADETTTDLSVALRNLGGATGEPDAALGRLIKEVGYQGPCTLILFVPAQPGRWQEALRRQLDSFKGPVHCVMALDALPQKRLSQARRLFGRRAVDTTPAPTARAFVQAWQSLQHLRPESLHLLNRRTGESVNAGQLIQELTQSAPLAVPALRSRRA